MADRKQQAEGRQVERRLCEKEVVREWERRIRGRSRVQRSWYLFRRLGAGGRQSHLPLFWLQGGEYPVRALDADEAELIVDRIHVHVRSGTAQIMTNNPMLQFPFWDGPRFWEGKWLVGYCSNLRYWVDTTGGR